MKLVNRRDFLRLSAGLGLGVLVAACAPKATPVPTEAPKEAPKQEEVKPTEAPTKAPSTALYAGFDRVANKEQWQRLPADHQKGTMISQADWYEILGDPPKEPVELAAFLGGWGEKWADLLIEQMKKEHPGIQITKNMDPRIWEKIKPRLIAGDVPDWMNSALGGWGGEWRQGVEDGLVIPADIILDVEAYGQPGKRMEDVMFPGALEAANGGLSDHQWCFPMSQYVLGIYYNADLFAAENWPHPDDLTWEEFMDLQKKIKEKIDPWTYAGKYPGYATWIMTPLEYKKAGAKAFCDMDNLVEGAFLNPDILWGIEQVQQIFKNGWIFAGSDAMTHTESQQIFVDGKCAMIPNGSWMENEQKATTPEGFRMKFTSVPAPKDAKGHKYALQASIGSADQQVGNGKNPLWGMEMMRVFYSPEMRKLWAEELGTPVPMKDALVGSKVSEALQSVVDALAKAEGTYVDSFYGSWYPTVSKPFGDNTGDVLWGKISAKEIMEQTERAAKEAREDSTVTKYTRTKGCS